MGKTFDLLETDPDTIKLGDLGEFTLGDIGVSRAAKLEKLQERIDELGASDDAEPVDHVRALADFVEAACDDSEGLAEKIVALYEADGIGTKALGSLVRFVAESLSGSTASVGEV